MYFSLQYLSLSDAVVLRFLAPILTGFSGAIFLKESLSLKGILAGCEHIYTFSIKLNWLIFT
jgi:drug/metabolite transporter (DMT)-like permease